MRLSDFVSEFGDDDIPTVTGLPKANSALGATVDAMDPGVRVEATLANMLHNAVYHFYFAKQACPELVAIAAIEGNPVARAADVVSNTLLKQAVLGVATTFDLTTTRSSGPQPATGRTMSLPHALDALERELAARVAAAPSTDTDSAADLLRTVKASTNADTVLSLKYVRHLRNKWAGHATFDREFDSWADADTGVNFPLLEDAVARMVNACQDLGTLASISDDLRSVEAETHPPSTESDGTVVIQMGLAWAGANALAQAMREIAKKHADALIRALQAQ